MEINEDLEIFEIQKRLNSSIGIKLTTDQVWKLRKRKILKYLERWKIENPLEFSNFKNLSWYSYTSERGDIIEITFNDVILYIGRNYSHNFLYISVKTISNFEQYQITPQGFIVINSERDAERNEILTKALEFLFETKLINSKYEFSWWIWR